MSLGCQTHAHVQLCFPPVLLVTPVLWRELSVTTCVQAAPCAATHLFSSPALWGFPLLSDQSRPEQSPTCSLSGPQELWESRRLCADGERKSCSRHTHTLIERVSHSARVKVRAWWTPSALALQCLASLSSFH